MRSILPSTPLDLVDLFFYLQGFEVVELGFVRLELCVEFVFARFLLLGMSVGLLWAAGGADPLNYEGAHLQTHSAQRGLPDHPCRQSLDNCQCGRTRRWR